MPRRAVGELENDVLTILWSAGIPLTPSEVLEQHGSNLAYTTVMTVLSRLWQKGHVTRTQRGRAFGYAPKLSEGEFGAAQLAEALSKVQDRPAALSRFVGTLSGAEARQLRAALDERGRQK